MDKIRHKKNTAAQPQKTNCERRVGAVFCTAAGIYTLTSLVPDQPRMVRYVRKGAKLLLTQSLVPLVRQAVHQHTMSPSDGALLTGALECCMAGDMILASDKAHGSGPEAKKMLVYGSVAFLGAHVCLITTMYRRGARLTFKHGLPRYALLVPPVIKIAAKDRSVAAAIAVYGSALCTMSTMTAGLADLYDSGTSTRRNLVRGGWSFLVSDALIALDTLMGADMPKAVRMLTQAGIDVTYAGALWNIVNAMASSPDPT